MIEQKDFPHYLSEDKSLLQNRVALMLTYEQTILIPAALRLLDSLLSNPIVKIFFNPRISAHESNIIESIHNSCINCILSQEAHARTKTNEN